MKAFFEILGFSPKDTGNTHGSLYAELERFLSGREEDKAKLIVGLAGILGRVAFSDGEISDLEVQKIKEILRDKTTFSESDLEDVCKVLARLTTELVGIEDYRYSRMLNHVCSGEEKLQILESLFVVAAANRSITAEEEKSIRDISNALLITNYDYLRIRAKFRESLDFLKDLPQ